MFRRKINERKLFDEYYHLVYKISIYMTRDEEMAQDVLQESFIKVFKNINSLEDKAKLEAWIKTITRRTALDFLRKKKRWNEEPTDDVYLENGGIELKSEIEDSYEEKELREMILEVIEQMKPEFREVMYLKFIEEMQDQEIAEELEIKLGTVKSRIHRAKNEIKRKLQQGGDHHEG